MRSVFTCTIVIVVSSAFAQRPFAHHAENFRKAVPHHNHHDQENFDRRMDKIARWHKIEPHQPPLRPHQTVPWLRWVHEGRWAAQANKNTELHRVRARLLEEKLRPNHLAFKPRINPQLKPRLKKENARTKRETEKSENENVQKETEIEVNVRHKRDIRMAQQVPEIIMKSYPDAEMPQATEQFHGRVKELEKRGKRQVVYYINRPPQQLARSPRTTPNPFIRDTHIDDYDIIRPEVGEREGMIPTIESGSSDLGSYPLMTFQKLASDLSKKLFNLQSLISDKQQDEKLHLVPQAENEQREKRSPKMSKLKKKQKIEKKKRKKKKQKELSPRQIKHIRRKKESKERRKRLHAKKLKEKRRLRHKKLGTGPYNKTITDYYGIYYDPPSSQLNESLYDSIYDTSEIDSDAIYEERMKERYDEYQESESEDSDAYYDEQLYGDTKEASDEKRENDEKVSNTPTGSKEKTKTKNGEAKNNKKASSKLQQTAKAATAHSSNNNKTGSDEKGTTGS